MYLRSECYLHYIFSSEDAAQQLHLCVCWSVLKLNFSLFDTLPAVRICLLCCIDLYTHLILLTGLSPNWTSLF